jgi:serine/threonine protein kinase
VIHAQALVGTTLGNVTLQKVLGQGELGVVFLAQRSPADPQLAVKILSPATTHTSGQQAAFLERFRHAINAISSLEHQNILPLFEYGKHAGLAYLVMPYIGGTLQNAIEQKSPLQLTEIAHYLDQLAAALDYAHTRGVLHLDIKPNNVLMNGEGRLFLTDFGQMKIISGRQTSQMHLLRAGTPVGSIDYMAPEQVMGDVVDARTDLYSLGVMLYHLVTGQTPFQGTPLQLATQHVQTPPPSPGQLREDLPAAAEQVMLQALAKRPLDRHASAQDLARAFSAAITTPASLAERPAGAQAGLPLFSPGKRGLFDPAWQQTAEDVVGEQGESKSTGLLTAAGIAAFRPNAPTPAAPLLCHPERSEGSVSKAPDTPPPSMRLRLGLKSSSLRPIDGPAPSSTVDTTKESDTSATTGELLRSSLAPLPTALAAPEQFSPFPFPAQPAQLTKSPSVPGEKQNTTGAMAIPRPTQPLSSFPAADTTGTLMIPGSEIGANGTVKLKGAVKVVQVPVVGQPGHFVTGFLPVLPPIEPSEQSSGTTKKVTTGRNYTKLLKKVALPLLVLLILASSGLFWFSHTRPTTTSKSAVHTEKLNPDWQAVAAVQASATANANYILTDSLQQNIHNWPIAKSGNKTYMFSDGAYHVTDNDARQSAPALLPDVILSKPLAYTLTMEEIKGNDGSINNSFGLILFLDTQLKNGKSVITFYSFEVVNTKKGEYQFLKYDSSKGQSPYVTIWHHSFSREFHQGHGAAYSNTIKVLVNRKYFTFWVNGKNVGSAQDSSIQNGQVGMLVNLKGTEVAFSNLQLTYN